MQSQLVVAAERVFEGLPIGRFAIEPGDLILILVGQQLGVGPRDGPRQLVACRKNGAFDLGHALDQRATTGRIGLVLIGGEMRHAVREDIVE